MGLTVAITKRAVSGDMNIIAGTIAFDSSYPTGGEALAPKDFGLRQIDLLLVQPAVGLAFEYDYTNQKLKAFRSAGFTPAGSNTAPTVTITGGQGAGVAVQISSDADAAVLGKTAATTRTGITGVQAPVFTGTAVAEAAFAEVANLTNLATVTGVRYFAVGV